MAGRIFKRVPLVSMYESGAVHVDAADWRLWGRLYRGAPLNPQQGEPDPGQDYKLRNIGGTWSVQLINSDRGAVWSFRGDGLATKTLTGSMIDRTALRDG